MKLSLFILLIPIIIGCSSPPHRYEWTRAPGHQPLPGTLRVLPLEDRRPLEYDDRTSVSWVPLVPFGPATYNRPGPRMGLGSPATDIPRTLAAEIEGARIFEAVDTGLLQGKPGDEVQVDYILEGEVIATRMDTKFMTYGLSFLAAPLWVVGMPVRRFALVVEARLRIRDASGGSILWEYPLKEESGHWQGLYYGRDVRRFSELTTRGAQRAILHLDGAIGMGLWGERG
jgi:hypothetical protein